MSDEILDRNRLTELEERLEHQDDTITQLNDALVNQQQRIDSLETKLEEVRSTLLSVTEIRQPLDPNERPPHY